MWRELADFAFGVGGSELLLVVKEGGSKTALGIIVHFLRANLKLDNLSVWRNDGGMERLITVGFWHGNIVFDTTVHRMVQGMNNTENKVAGRDVFNNKTQGD